MKKNILQQYWDGSQWVEIHPLTKASNVYTRFGNSVEMRLDATVDRQDFFPTVSNDSMVTFIDDDGSVNVWNFLKDMFSSRNVPCTLGIISDTNFLTTNQLLHLQNDLGWEIASHSKTHADLSTLTESQIDFEMRVSKENLLAKGLNVDNIIYPYGGHNALVRKVARKYYRCGVDAKGGINKTPLKQFSINRQGIGIYTPDAQKNLNHYKAMIDEAKARKQWLVFMLHIGEYTAQERQDLASTIDYAIAQGVRIGNLRDGLKEFGNMIFEGDYNGSLDNDKYKILTNQGTEFTNQMKKSDVSIDTYISQFPFGESTHTFLSAENSGFPNSSLNAETNGAGLLHTYRDKNDDRGFSYQIFRPYSSSDVWFRTPIEPSGLWGGFTLVSGNIHYGDYNAYVASSVPGEFPQFRVTINRVLNAQANGFPENKGGVLITYRNGEHEFVTQKYQIAEDAREFCRRWVNNTWGQWEVVGGDTHIRSTVNMFSSSTLPRNFPLSQITTFFVNSEGSSGFPTSAGIVTVYRTSSLEYGFIRQEFRPYNSNEIWSRYENSSNGNWSSWVKISAV